MDRLELRRLSFLLIKFRQLAAILLEEVFRCLLFRDVNVRRRESLELGLQIGRLSFADPSPLDISLLIIILDINSALELLSDDFFPVRRRVLI